VCLNSTTLEELVFAIPTDELWKLLTYKEKGLIIENSEILNRVFQNGLFRKRSELEEDPSFKQIIPYAIISNKDVVINETDMMTADWIDKPGLAEFYERMETWTKIAFDHYIK
jgi:predicted NUDIX family phosphoesterase